MTSRIDLSEQSSDLVPGPVPYAAIVPNAAKAGEPVPLCLTLHGGGANRDFLVAQQPLLDAMWAAGTLPQMVLASASTGELSFYLDQPDGKIRWETFLIDEARSSRGNRTPGRRS